jgi:hypothetical protein
VDDFLVDLRESVTVVAKERAADRSTNYAAVE